MSRRIVRVGGRSEPGETLRPDIAAKTPSIDKSQLAGIATKPPTTIQEANAYIKTVEAQVDTLQLQSDNAQAELDALIESEQGSIGTVVRTEEGGPGIYLYKTGKGKYTQESFTKFQEDTQKFVEGTDDTISQLKENVSTINRALESVVVRTPTTRQVGVPSAKQYFTVKDPRTGTSAKFLDKADAQKYRDNLVTELTMAKRARVGSEARQEWERMQEVASQSSQRVALAELVSEGIVTTGEGKEGAISYQFKADPKTISQDTIDLARVAGFDVSGWFPTDTQQEFGGGGGARKGNRTRTLALKLFADVVAFAGEIAKTPRKGVPNLADIKRVREPLGEWFKDLQELGNIARVQGELPTRDEVKAYIDSGAGKGIPGPARGDNPFAATTPEQFYNRLAKGLIDGVVSVTALYTYPVSHGLAPMDPQHPEELATRVTASLLIYTPADRIFGGVIETLGVKKAAVNSIGKLQKLGIRGKEILDKLLGGKSFDKLQGEVFESIAGSNGISTNQLRKLIIESFEKEGAWVRLWDDPKQVAMVEQALDNAIDYTKLSTKFNDMPITAKDTQSLVSAEVKRIIGKITSGMDNLGDIDPGLNTLTNWGVLNDHTKNKIMNEIVLALSEMDIHHFAMGGITPETKLIDPISDVLLDAFDDLDDFYNEFFNNPNDLAEFIRLNPRAIPLILDLLNQPAKDTEISARLLQEIEKPWDIETDLSKLDIDLKVLQELGLKTDLDIDQKFELELELLPVEIPDILETSLETPTKVEQKLDLDLDTLTPIDITEPIPIIVPEPIEPLPVDPIQRQVELLRQKMLREGTPGVARATKALRLKLNVQKRKYKEARRIKPSKKSQTFYVYFQYATGASEREIVESKSWRSALVTANRSRKIRLIPLETTIEKRG